MLAVLDQRSASAIRVTGMGAGGIDLAERLHKGGEADGRLLQVVDRAVGVLAGQPLIHRPVEGMAPRPDALSPTAPEALAAGGGRAWAATPLRWPLAGGPADARQPSCQVVADR